MTQRQLVPASQQTGSLTQQHMSWASVAGLVRNQKATYVAMLYQLSVLLCALLSLPLCRYIWRVRHIARLCNIKWLHVVQERC